MAAYELNNKVKFILPSKFVFSRGKDEEGNEQVKIQTGEYVDEDGDICYRFNCRVIYTEYDPEELDDEYTSDNLIELWTADAEPSKRMYLSGAPKTILINFRSNMSFLGDILQIYSLTSDTQVEDWTLLKLIITGIEDDTLDEAELYNNFYEVLKSVRVKGKKLAIDGLTSSHIREKLRLESNEDKSFVEVTPKFEYESAVDNDTTPYEHFSEIMKQNRYEMFKSVDPAEKLYPHYASIQNSIFNFVSGGVVNASGTEFKFQNFDSICNMLSSDSNEMRQLLKRINDLNPPGYTLANKARNMIKLFRVKESSFDSGNDRESELIHGYMHRAYMMSAIRSFAWTLTDYCKENKFKPEEISSLILFEIVDFISFRNWLNYDDKTHCKGLCSGSDLHVYYLPDGVSKIDKDELLPSQEDRDKVKKIKAKFPNYNEILCEVHSLNALRKDLNYIYPAIKRLYDILEKDRDYSDPLEGDVSDIVYSWIALAIAAESPFFTEDGPMSYRFDWPGSNDEEQVGLTTTNNIKSISSEAQKGTEAINNRINDLKAQIDEAEDSISKYDAYLEQKKAQEKEKKEKKSKARAEGKSEKDIVNMYVILTNEKKLGQLHRAQDEFYKVYEDVFPALTKAEVLKVRKEILAVMEDEPRCSYYVECFKQRSVEDRFSVSVRNLNNAGKKSEVDEKAEWAIENSKEWFDTSEYAEVRRLMQSDMKDQRKKLDEQLKIVDEAWVNFSTARNSLQIVVSDKADDNSDMQEDSDNFQVVFYSQLISVELATKGLCRISTTIMNSFTWYWGVTVRDIWEAANLNEFENECKNLSNADQIVDYAMNQIRSKHTAMKTTIPTSDYSKKSAVKSKSHTPSSKSKYFSDSYTDNNESRYISTQQPETEKNEGCYIATAVYGSYGAPEVMILRRFRDETLKNSVFGRWFIRTYYRLSPPVAKKLKNMKLINAFVRHILDKWIKKLEF